MIVAATWRKKTREMAVFIYCRLPIAGQFLEVGRVSTGLKKRRGGVTFQKLTKLLKPSILDHKGASHGQAQIVVEVAYEEIQKVQHSSGYAMRFPGFAPAHR